MVNIEDLLSSGSDTICWLYQNYQTISTISAFFSCGNLNFYLKVRPSAIFLSTRFIIWSLVLVTNIADIMLTYVNQQSIHHYALKGKIAMSTADIVEHSHSLKRLNINYLLFYVDYKDFNPVSIQLSHAKNER